MSHPLIQQLFDQHHYPEVTLDTHDDFTKRPGVNVLFFAGDPKRYRDTTDVAVVLPELDKAFDGQRSGPAGIASNLYFDRTFAFSQEQEDRVRALTLEEVNQAIRDRSQTIPDRRIWRPCLLVQTGSCWHRLRRFHPAEHVPQRPACRRCPAS